RRRRLNPPAHTGRGHCLHLKKKKKKKKKKKRREEKRREEKRREEKRREEKFFVGRMHINSKYLRLNY
ncbi:hypothetical protein, partial [Neisseria gonorrhoeae]|uniref:hypothetical protein n=1 Tax=Neisseria gonorrhoeae TaxID=485 RepID=UPI00070CDF02